MVMKLYGSFILEGPHANGRDVIQEMLQLLGNERLDDGEDCLRWKLTSNGIFTVKSFYDKIKETSRAVHDVAGPEFRMKLVWRVPITSKVKFFIWSVLLGKLQTAEHLRHKGMEISVECGLCGDTSESIQHLFIECAAAKQVWEKILYGVLNFDSLVAPTMTVKDLLKLWPNGRGGNLGLKLWEVLPYAVLWSVWRCRNNIVFRNTTLNIDNLVVEIKALAWYWVGGILKNDGYRFQDILVNWEQLLGS